MALPGSGSENPSDIAEKDGSRWFMRSTARALFLHHGLSQADDKRASMVFALVTSADSGDIGQDLLENWLGMMLMIVRDKLSGKSSWTSYFEGMVETWLCSVVSEHTGL